MVARVKSWLAIAIGGAGGTLLALVGSGAPPAPAAGLPPIPRPALSTEVQSALPAHGQSSVAAAAGPKPAQNAASAPIPSAAARTAPPLPSAELLPLPTTQRALLLAEMRCDERKADFCIVAARSYEGGSAGPRDPEKAAKYRRIALTAWLKECDKNSAAACAVLATMYRSGSGVTQSERTADALVTRVRDLCRYKPVPVCNELPPLE